MAVFLAAHAFRTGRLQEKKKRYFWNYDDRPQTADDWLSCQAPAFSSNAHESWKSRGLDLQDAGLAEHFRFTAYQDIPTIIRLPG